MDYQHYPYPETMQLPVYLDSPSMEATTMEGMIDPILKPSPWTPPQMHRYLTESSKSSLWGHTMMDSVFPETVIRRDDGVTPLPSSLLGRRDSPSFSHTSTTSSALSPPRESDYYQVHSPPTPTDTTIMSPYMNQYESASSRAQLYQYTGLADDCVKPIHINLSQDSPESYCDDSNARPEFPSRGYSMSSDEGSLYMDSCNVQEPLEEQRPLSPEGFSPEMKEEIYISEPIQNYPTYEPDNEPMSSDEIELPIVKQEAEDDDDYKPNQKPKRAKSGSSRSTRSRKRRNSSGSTSGTKRPKVESSICTAISRSATKPMIQGAKGSFSCTECSKTVYFKDESSLQNHIKKQHTRPFVCVFSFAGCTSTFASKNEWKRHCSSQHLVLNYWICQENQCSKTSNRVAVPQRNRSDLSCSQNTNTCAMTIPRGTIFNRKDLYTQHLRRMHIPASLKKQVKQRKPAPEWEAQERQHQDQAKRTRCNLPTHMRCPAFGCGARFDGANAWDDRMEHVARHLEKAVAGSEQPIEFGGAHDDTLLDWATRPDIAIIERGGDKGRWKLRNPLRSSGGRMVEITVDREGEEDAEGEEVDE